MIVHLGVVVVSVAFTASSSFATEAELRLERGDRARVGGHTIEYVSSRTVEEPNKISSRAVVLVDGRRYEPALSRFADSNQAIGTPSVRPGLDEDVYLAILEVPGESSQAITLRVIIQPLVTWLWIGGAVMAGGTLLAAFPGRRRRLPLQPASALVPGVELREREPVAAR